jgi:uncharacterized glyoxalase superfamily protein PhnB
MKAVNIKKITPVLFAEEVEPAVKFWAERLGFNKTVEVPDGDKLAFAMVVKDGVELMYQTYASADRDDPGVAQMVRKGPTFLYVEVEDVKLAHAAMQGIDVDVPMHDTFYGAREFSVKDPAGHLITFAQQGAAGQP